MKKCILGLMIFLVSTPSVFAEINLDKKDVSELLNNANLILTEGNIFSQLELFEADQPLTFYISMMQIERLDDDALKALARHSVKAIVAQGEQVFYQYSFKNNDAIARTKVDVASLMEREANRYRELSDKIWNQALITATPEDLREISRTINALDQKFTAKFDQQKKQISATSHYAGKLKKESASFHKKTWHTELFGGVLTMALVFLGLPILLGTASLVTVICGILVLGLALGNALFSMNMGARADQLGQTSQVISTANQEVENAFSILSETNRKNLEIINQRLTNIGITLKP